MRLVAECPGKINLMLRVVDRRPDGFHELDTVFQTIDLRDRLEIGPGDGLHLTCDDPGIPCDESNLVLRAVRLLERDVARRPLEASLVLRKSLPAQAGLGGGSSDAAGALRLGCRFWGLDPSPKEIERLAAELGADVPFFLVGGTARGTGRGDRIEALAPLPETPLILGFPPFGVSTAEVFGRIAGRLTLPRNGVSLPIPFGHKWPEGKDLSLVFNDLEQVVFDGWPELKRFRDALLEAGAARALLSGSGSTVFGIFRTRAESQQALGELRDRFSTWKLLVSRTVSDGIRVSGL